MKNKITNFSYSSCIKVSTSYSKLSLQLVTKVLCVLCWSAKKKKPVVFIQICIFTNNKKIFTGNLNWV